MPPPHDGLEVGLVCSNPALATNEFKARKRAGRSAGQKRTPIRISTVGRNNIPVWVRFSSTLIIACARGLATHVLVHVSESLGSYSGRGHFRVGKYSVPVVEIVSSGLKLSYLDLEYPVTMLPPLVRQRLSAMYSMVDGYDFGDRDGTSTVVRKLSPDLALLRSWKDVAPPVRDEFPKAKVTGEHHTHVLPDQVWRAAQAEAADRIPYLAALLRRLRKMADVTEAFATTAMLYVCVVPKPMAHCVALSTVLWKPSLDATFTALKEFSTPMKALQNADFVDLTPLFELQTLVNRGVGAVDWRKEKVNRTNPDVIDVAPEDVYSAAVRIFRSGASLGFKYKKMSLQDFADSRWEWSPAGSVHSQYEADQEYIFREEYRHRTKFVTLNAMSSQYVKAMFTRAPQVRAWPSVKYEWGKERAIYGVDLTSATVAHFGLFNCEEVFKHRFPVGEDAEAERVHKRLKLMLSSSESCCYDFDDFNAQHSTASMVAVILAYRDVFRQEMSPEQLAAVEWVADSLLDVEVIPTDGSPAYKVNGTLLSGSRLTTFLNTALNFIYMDVSGALSAAGVVDSVHNGDDVLLAVRTTRAVVEIHERMARINARAQATKCNVFSTGEFLRVDHKLELSDGLGAQYASRACATAVHSRVESQQPVRATLAAQASLTRFTELKRRCPVAGSFIDNLCNLNISHLADVFSVDITALRTAVHAHVVAGGMSTDRWAPVDVLINEVTSDTPEQAPEGGVTTTSLQPGIHDYARKLFRVVREAVPYDSILASVYRATRSQLEITRKTSIQLLDVSLSVRFKCARALYKSLRGIIRLPFVPRARFLNVPPVALASSDQVNKLMSVLPTSGDTAWAMKIML